MVVAAGAAIATAGAGATVRAGTIYQSAALGPTGQRTGFIVDADNWAGVRFQVTSTTTATRMGGHLYGNTNPTANLFAALVQLSGASDFPDSANLSTADVLRTGVVAAPFFSDDVGVSITPVILNPGYYALIFGSQRFGATGSGGLTSNNTIIGSPSFFFRDPVGNWIDSSSSGMRYFVSGPMTRGWASPASGDWLTPASWNAPVVPDSFDDATFDQGGTYTVTFANNAVANNLIDKRDNATFNLGTHTLSAGGDVTVGGGGGTAVMTLQNGTLAQGSTHTIYVGGASAATLAVNGSGIINNPNGSLIVGYHSQGNLILVNGTVNSSNGRVADDPVLGGGALSGGQGAVAVNSGGTWNVTNNLLVGRNGPGVVDINPGGTLSVGITMTISNSAGTAVDLQGGTLKLATLSTSGNPSRFNWTSGMLWFYTTINEFDVASFGPLGANVTVGSGMTLQNNGQQGVFSGGTLSVAGGTLSGNPRMFVDGALIQSGGSSTLGPVDPLFGTSGTINVTGGTLTADHVRLSSLSLGGTGKVIMRGSGGATTGTSVLGALNFGGTTDAWLGQLDIKDNDVIVNSTAANRVADVARITNQLKQGLNASGTLWSGNGIITSLGGASGSNFTGIGVIYNDFSSIGQPAGPIFTTFSGQSVTVNDVLIKYTYFGDTDLSGQITSADYFQIDTGFLAHRTGWINGDFDYNGIINSSDYFLIDSAFLHQGAGTLVPSATASAVPEPTSVGAMALTLLGLRRRRRARRHKALTVAALAAAATGATAGAGTIYESATMGPAGQHSGFSVTSDSFDGVRFQVTTTVTADRLGGHLFGGNAINPNSNIFGALVALGSAGDVPDSPDLSTPDVLRTGIINVTFSSADAAMTFTPITLTPGYYAIVFGSGLFGATGSGGLTSNNTMIGTPSYFFRNQNGNWQNSTSTDMRYFITGPATRGWANAGGGSWNTAGNWSPAVLPDTSDDATFNLAGGYTVTFSANASVNSVTDRADNVTLNLAGRTLTTTGGDITVGYLGTATLSVQGGTVSQTSTANLYIGNVGPGSGAGVMNVNGNGVVNSPNSMLVAGYRDTGTLAISNGTVTSFWGRVADDPALGPGINAAGAGNVTVNAAGTWNITDTFYVGRNGAGVVTINSGGTISAGGETRIFNTDGGTIVNLNGGTLKCASLNTGANTNRFNWTSGKLWFYTPNDQFDLMLGGQLGAIYSIIAGKTLEDDGLVAIHQPGLLTVGGGTFMGNPHLLVDGTFTQSSGTSILGAIDPFTPGNNGTMNVTGGTCTADHVRQNALRLGGTGVLVMRASGGAASGTSVLGALTFDGTTDSWLGQLDVKDNDIIVHSTSANRAGDVARFTNQLKQGLNASGTLWTGNGIVTSLGGDSGSNFTGIGIIYNDFSSSGQPPGAIFTTFSGQSVNVNDVLIKYTYFGDADLNGIINSSDYFQIDTGFLAHRTGWINGDFDYNGIINTSDYFLVDSAFLHQGAGTLVPTETISAVPEPACLGAIGLTLLLGRRRRRRRTSGLQRKCATEGTENTKNTEKCF